MNALVMNIEQLLQLPFVLFTSLLQLVLIDGTGRSNRSEQLYSKTTQKKFMPRAWPDSLFYSSSLVLTISGGQG